jgi:hypothetical protein
MPVNDTDFLFPPRIIPYLRDLRGEEWMGLVDRSGDVPADDLERLAFVLMMVRLAGCVSCQADSYKAMRGCTICAIQTIRRYKGDDVELLRNLETAKHDVVTYLKNNHLK